MDEERTLVDAARVMDSLSVTMRTHLWITWGRIALQHEELARAARQKMQHPGADQSRLLGREGDAGLVCICAAAFALEALSTELLELRVVPPATTTAWARNRPPADRQILEVLKHGFDPRGLVATWERELRWLFGVRGSSVHYEGSFAPPEIHPLGMGVAPTQATYRAENATRAVDLLLGILERCRDKPKPPIRAWSKHKRIRTPALLSPPGRSARRRIRSSCTRDCQRRSRDAALREGRRAGPFRRPALRLGGGYPRLKGLM